MNLTDLLPWKPSFYRYTVTGFIDKNKDPIYQDFKRLLYNRSVGVAVGVANGSRTNSALRLVSTHITS